MGVGGTSLGSFGQILTPLSARMALDQAAQICPSNFAGTDPNSPIGLAGAQKFWNKIFLL